MIDFETCIRSLEKKEQFQEIKKMKGFSYEQIEEAFRFCDVTPYIFGKIVDDDLFYAFLAESFRFKADAMNESRGRIIFIDNLSEYIEMFYGEEL